jgi:hemoglobin/transferrin/lactoferrin receptor protein
MFRSNSRLISPRVRRLTAAVSAVAAVVATHQQAQAQTPYWLDSITVLATKTVERAIDSLAAVSTVREETLRQVQPTKTSDAFFGVPGVWFQERADDPGSAINIRGLQDFGRVAVLIDGARQNFQRTGHNADGVFYLEPEMIGGIDVVRGPVANIYGSGAIGGVVSFRTKDVEDLLNPNERWATEYFGVGNSNVGGVGSIFGAARLGPNAEVFAGGTFRQQGDYKDGHGDTINNTSYTTWSGTAKATLRPADGHRVKFGYTHYDTNFDTGQPPSSIYDTNVVNQIATARWTYAKPEDRLRDFDANVYWTRTNTEQTKTAGTGSVISGFIGDTRNFQVDTIGFDANNTSRFDTGPVRHAFTVGADAFRDAVDTTGFGVIFTPSGERTVTGGFAQLRSNYSTWLEIITALRYDRYGLEGGNFSTNGDRVSPKITVGLTPVPGITPYVTYAEGYRAPAVTETLISGIHPVPGAMFEFLPNPALKPEVGKSIDAGLNLKFDNVVRQGDKYRAKFNVFRNEVADFIEQIPLFTGQTGQGGFLCTNVIFGPPDCFQYQNITQAQLEGIEFESMYDAGPWFFGLSGSKVRGRNVETGAPLAKIAPAWVATTLGWRSPDQRFTVAVRWQAVAAKKADEIPATSGTLAFPPTGSYNLVNLYLGYQVNENTVAALSVENLLNEQYSRYMTVYPNPAPGSAPIAFPQPGIAVKGSFRVRFADVVPPIREDKKIVK